MRQPTPSLVPSCSTGIRWLAEGAVRLVVTSFLGLALVVALEQSLQEMTEPVTRHRP
jgi:hypothetical protein